MPPALRMKKKTKTANGGKLRMKGAKPQTKTPAPKTPATPPSTMKEKLVSFEVEGTRMAGKVCGEHGDMAELNVALPDHDGILLVTDSKFLHPIAELHELAGAQASEKKARMFNERVGFTVGEKMRTVRSEEEGPVVDYLDVAIEGFASTFKATTAADRDGDYVENGAFDATLVEFMKNPVMLTDHVNSTWYQVGSYSKVGINDMGLAVRGELSNSPGVQHIRFLVAEGHLKAFSIGGMFLYGMDGRAIERVDLYEISLVSVPANQDALFHTRAVEVADAKALWTKHQKNLRPWIGK